MKGLMVFALAAFGTVPLLTSPQHSELLKINAAKVLSSDPDWQRAKNEIYGSQNFIDIRISTLKSSELQRFVIRSGPDNRKEIALTFDDGPHPQATLALLKILRRQQIPATFFVVGFMAEKYPALVRAIRDGGHEIGNHTYSHVTLTKISSDQVLTEYRANNDAIFRIAGVNARYCRPPGGDFNSDVLKDAASLGLTTVLWTDDPGDYANPGDDIL